MAAFPRVRESPEVVVFEYLPSRVPTCDTLSLQCASVIVVFASCVHSLALLVIIVTYCKYPPRHTYDQQQIHTYSLDLITTTEKYIVGKEKTAMGVVREPRRGRKGRWTTR